MLTQVHLENFRSIEKANIELAPITVLYGATSSGKSTMLYALSILRNFILNPNQATDGFFSLGFLNLGGFDACVFNHEATRDISIVASVKSKSVAGYYGIEFGKSSGKIKQGIPNLDMQCPIAIPYPVNQNFPFPYKGNTGEFSINWNGITSSAVPSVPTAESQSEATEISTRANSIVELIKAIDISPHRRGFFSPIYNPVPISSTPTNENEVASLLINDQNLPPKIGLDVDEIFDRDFRVHTVPGTATTSFLTTDKKSRTPVNLVNDGFGVNQVIYMLAKLHRQDVRTLLIEEPEIHLHPSVIRKFVKSLCAIVTDDGKQIILATHSEHFLISLLNCVSEKVITSDDIRCYHVLKDKKKTRFENQLVSAEGQIEGGLASFVEVELEHVKRFVSAVK